MRARGQSSISRGWTRTPASCSYMPARRSSACRMTKNPQAVEVTDRKLLKDKWGETFPSEMCWDSPGRLNKAPTLHPLSYRRAWSFFAEQNQSASSELSDLFLHRRSPGLINHGPRTSRGEMWNLWPVIRYARVNFWAIVYLFCQVTVAVSGYSLIYWVTYKSINRVASCMFFFYAGSFLQFVVFLKIRRQEVHRKPKVWKPHVTQK